MNKKYIVEKLKNLHVPFEYVWYEIGPTIRFLYYDFDDKKFHWMNCLVPLDDDSDENFVMFVYKKYSQYVLGHDINIMERKESENIWKEYSDNA